VPSICDTATTVAKISGAATVAEIFTEEKVVTANQRAGVIALTALVVAVVDGGCQPNTP